MEGLLNCTKCNNIKLEEDFYVDKRKVSGRSSICISCQKKKEGKWEGEYKCYGCDNYFSIEQYRLYNSGGRSRKCKECVEDSNWVKGITLWESKNKPLVKKFIKHVREVTGINGVDDLLKKYQNPK